MHDKTSLPKWATSAFSSDYINPLYYDKMIKKYSSNRIDDLIILKEYLGKYPHNKNILELGCGSGRATKILLSETNCKVLTVTDLSKQMIDYVTKSNEIMKLINVKRNPCIMKPVEVDNFKYLQETREIFNNVISLWSLGHSTRPLFEKYGLKCTSIIEEILTSFIIKNLANKGSIFIMQTDWSSEEQQLRKRCRLLANPEIAKELYSYKDSTIVRVLKSVFYKLVDKGIMNKECTKATCYFGDEIVYGSVDEALEVFMNFHFAAEFNTAAKFDLVSNFFREEFEKIILRKGKLSIGTGFWVFEGEKN